MQRLFTIGFVQQGDQVLLGLKKRGFAKGRFIGFGGKVEAGEALVDAMVRELEEESGLRAKQVEPAGVVTFRIDWDWHRHDVHVFRIRDFVGTPIETDEMRPQWFSVDAIPYEQMMPDDLYWLPQVLAGQTIEASFAFVGETLVSRDVERVSATARQVVKDSV